MTKLQVLIFMAGTSVEESYTTRWTKQMPTFARRETVGVRCHAGISLKRPQNPKMATQHRHTAGLLGAFLLLLALSAAAQSAEQFKARLSTVPVDATMLPTVAGSGSLKAVLTGNKLVISGTFAGLRSPAIRASIHIGPQEGIRGPAVHELSVAKEEAGSVSGTVELTASEVEDLKNRRVYVQIDSERAPEGNLWGWVLR
jgi:CHRD domain-containing protein